MTIKDALSRFPLARRIAFSLRDRKNIKAEMAYCPQKLGTGKEQYPKDIYLIRWVNPEAGLFAYVLNIMGEIWYAKKKGMVPVVDMMSQKNTYLSEEEVGKVNVWNYYFESVSELSVEDCAKYENVFVSGPKGQLFSPCPSVGWMKTKKAIRMWQTFAKENLKLNDAALNVCERDYHAMIEKGDRILGVKARGTDYTHTAPKGHPIQPDVNVIIRKAKKLMQKHGYNKVYLSTEDRAIVEAFRREFGDALLVSESARVDYDPKVMECVSLYSTGRENDRYLQGLEYLRDEYILSKANALIGGINGGSAAALMMGENFEHTYFWYLGRY